MIHEVQKLNGKAEMPAPYIPIRVLLSCPHFVGPQLQRCLPCPAKYVIIKNLVETVESLSKKTKNKKQNLLESTETKIPILIWPNICQVKSFTS